MNGKDWLIVAVIIYVILRRQESVVSAITPLDYQPEGGGAGKWDTLEDGSRVFFPDSDQWPPEL